jgi:chemotaxis protein histidine kinase CheA
MTDFSRWDRTSLEGLASDLTDHTLRTHRVLEAARGLLRELQDVVVTSNAMGVQRAAAELRRAVRAASSIDDKRG